VNCVHDEIIVECDEALAPAVKNEIEQIMMECSGLILNGITIEVEADIADTGRIKGENRRLYSPPYLRLRLRIRFFGRRNPS
jgi:hypothetical protein